MVVQQGLQVRHRGAAGALLKLGRQDAGQYDGTGRVGAESVGHRGPSLRADDAIDHQPMIGLKPTDRGPQLGPVNTVYLASVVSQGLKIGFHLADGGAAGAGIDGDIGSLNRLAQRWHHGRHDPRSDRGSPAEPECVPQLNSSFLLFLPPGLAQAIGLRLGGEGAPLRSVPDSP